MSQATVSAHFQGYDFLAHRRGYVDFLNPFGIGIHIVLFKGDSFSGITSTKKLEEHGQGPEGWAS